MESALDEKFTRCAVRQTCLLAECLRGFLSLALLVEGNVREISGTFEGAKLHHFDIGNGQSHV
jgi:hypothetical protein